ncbi:MAG: methyltransferase, partial [Nannocystaceae bacterium]|nr:methyltransferase [Nannocystaceae bacterium]
ALDPALLTQIRSRASDSGFDAGLIARAESVAPSQLDQVRRPLVHAWLRRNAEPAAVWARLFAYDDAVEATTASKSLGPQIVEALTGIDVLYSSDGGLRSRLRLMPFANLLLASDEAVAKHDPVMGPGATTQELWSATNVPAGATVLDIGCGAGSLALAAARHGASQVVGVDLDPRAVDYSRLNARLNGVDNATFFCGSLLEPVAGRTFDLIVSQPPFVTQPDSIATTTYLHGGHRGDELTLRLLPQLPDALNPSGRALVLFDTAPPTDQTVTQLVSEVLGTDALQVIIVVAQGHSADEQAIGYASTTYADLGPDYAAAAATYRDHLSALGISTSQHVLLQLSRLDAGAPSFVAEVGTRGKRVYDASALAELQAGLRVAAAGPQAMMSAKIKVSRHAWLAQEQAFAGSDPEPSDSQPSDTHRLRVRFDGGRARDQSVSDAAGALLQILADTSELSVACQRYAEVCGTDVAAVQGAVFEFVRDSLVSGLLVVSE